jgi:hypothetical protein
MPDPVVHFEITGRDPDSLREYYAALFGWHADTNAAVAPEVSDAGAYGFIDHTGIPGGIGGGEGFEPTTVFYVGVPSVEVALRKAEELGGTRVLGPVARPDGELTVARFTDPEGNLIGLAGGA